MEEERLGREEDELSFEELEREMARFGLREWWEVEAEEARRREEDATAAEPASSHRSSLPVHRSQQRSMYGMAPLMMIPDGVVQGECSVPPPLSPPGISGDRVLLDGWRFPDDRIGRRHSFALQSFRGAGSVSPHAAWPGAFPAEAHVPLPLPPPAWPRCAVAVNAQAEKDILYLTNNEQMVLDTLSWGSPDAAEAVAKVIVRYAAPLMESSHGNHLLGQVLSGCGHGLRDSIVARITRDKKRFFRICAERSDEVVRMIRSCRSTGSLQLLRNAIVPWMAPSMMQGLVTDSNRLKVVQAFVQCVRPCFAEFIFDVVAKNCLAFACHPHGLSLLRSCLEHIKGTEKDNVLLKVSRWSFYLAQSCCGNYIVQDVLKQRDPSHLAIIASCFRNNYVELSKQKYSSNVVETCLDVFDDVEQFAIVHELIWYPHFRDLATDKFANYVISKALSTCKAPLRHRLATAILSIQNVNRRHPHCLKIFNKLSELGYIQQRN